MTIQLQFGLNDNIPQEAPAAWGARWIITQDGYIDQVPDRTDAVGEPDAKARLFDHLNSKVRNAPKEKLRELLQSGAVNTRIAERIVLHVDELVSVVGNTNASGGYFYVTAYIRPEA